MTRKGKMFRKRFAQGTGPRPQLPPLDEAAEPVPAPRVEPIRPRTPPVELKDIVAPSPRRTDAGAMMQPTGRRLVVGRDIVLSGEITDCEALIIEGRVEGDITKTQRLEIAESGRFKGTAEVQECLVGGACEGELTVNGLLSVRTKGRVGGRVRYVEVQIDRGGRLSGDVAIQTVREIATEGEPAAAGADDSSERAPHSP